MHADVFPVSGKQVLGRAAIVLSIAAIFVIGMWYGTRFERSSQPWGRERLLSTALDSVRVNFLDSLPESELMRRAVSGMLRELHDPYAALMEREGVSAYRGSLRGESQSLGLVLRLRGSDVVVRRVMPGSPAHSAGVHAGDEIVAVDGVRAAEAWSGTRPQSGASDSSSLSSGLVQLNLVRFASSDTVSLAIRKGPWRTPAVTESVILSGGVAYVRLASSVAGSAEELERSVETVLERGARSLILDLRGNPGGLYDEGVLASSLFLPGGAVVSSLDRRGTSDQQVQTVKKSRWPNLPMAVLVDASTASSAELIAAALRDHKRALLIGDNTYGKGVVQRVVHINSDMALRLTTARWLTPSGKTLLRREEKDGRISGGLVPDIVIRSAARLDPSAVPSFLSPSAARSLSDAVDGVVARALLDGWAAAPLPLLERRLRGLLSQTAPTLDEDPLKQVTLVGDGTRVAVRRMLEMTRSDDELWSYSALDDPALRAGLSILITPPSDSISDEGEAYSPLPASASGDSLLVSRLREWLKRGFSNVSLSAFSDSVYLKPQGSPRIEGRWRSGVRDTVVALHFTNVNSVPLLESGWRTRFADPSGVPVPLTGRVLARTPFAVPQSPAANSSKRYGWAYVVVLPADSASAHSGGFSGWQLTFMPQPAPQQRRSPIAPVLDTAVSVPDSLETETPQK